MLDFGFSEILLTSAIALVVLGPERLPKVARQVGNWMGRARLMARQLSEQLEREVNAEELLKIQEKAKSAAMTRLGPAGAAPAQPVSAQPGPAELASAERVTPAAVQPQAAFDPLYPTPLAPDGQPLVTPVSPSPVTPVTPITPVSHTASASSADASKPPNE